jgi:hypothetical protein
MSHIFRLHRQLERAGIPVDGISADGRVDFSPEATSSQREEAARLVAALRPETPDSAETRRAILKAVLAEADKANGAAVSKLSEADVRRLLGLLLAYKGWLAADGTVDVP